MIAEDVWYLLLEFLDLMHPRQIALGFFSCCYMSRVTQAVQSLARPGRVRTPYVATAFNY